MPKLKTNKAAAKRYGFTATGKTKRTKHTARVQDGIMDKTCLSHVKKLLPYGD